MIEEEITVGSDTGHPLGGVLTLPDSTGGPVPGAVLVHGSGPSDRDEKIFKNYPFRDLAEGLAAHGVASIRYDKRTFVYGKKMKDDRSLSVREETIEDAILAADVLRADPRIDPDQVFVIGHSLGGMLAPRIDAEGGNFAGIVIMAGTLRSLEEVMKDQNEDLLNSVNRLLKIIARKQIAALNSKFDNIHELSDEEAKNTKVLGKHVMAYYFKEMGEHPASRYLAATDKPLLIVQGDRDFHVSVEKDFNSYKQLLDDQENVAFKLYPGLNHLFMPAVYGTVLKAKKEYKIPQKVDPQVIRDLADWIRAH